jgi:hypothetical protein
MLAKLFTAEDTAGDGVEDAAEDGEVETLIDYEAYYGCRG